MDGLWHASRVSSACRREAVLLRRARRCDSEQVRFDRHSQFARTVHRSTAPRLRLGVGVGWNDVEYIGLNALNRPRKRNNSSDGAAQRIDSWSTGIHRPGLSCARIKSPDIPAGPHSARPLRSFPPRRVGPSPGRCSTAPCRRPSADSARPARSPFPPGG